jgi:hypothetical protein
MANFKKKIIFICSFLFVLNTFAQTQLVVYQVNGNVTIKESKKKVFVGTLIDIKSTLIVQNGSCILLDNQSNMYEVSEKGTASFSSIKENKISSNSKSVSNRYLKYVYKKFLRQEEKNSIYGVVFRGNELLNFPKNYSYFLPNSFVDFNWNSIGQEEFYLWILNEKTNTIVGKYRLDYANSLSLLLPFKKGVYKWTVTTENSLGKNSTFYFFEIVRSNEFKQRENDSFYKAKKQIDLLLRN